MSTKTQTTTTRYHIQKKRRAEFLEEWRTCRQTVIREEDVTLVPTARGLLETMRPLMDPMVLFEEAEDTLVSMQELSQIQWPDDRRPGA